MNPVHAVLDYARTAPSAPAIVSSGFAMTYAELAASLVRFAARFRQLGIRRGSIVAVTASAPFETVIMLALLHEGAVSLTGSPSVLRAYGGSVDFVLSESPVAVNGAARVIMIDPEFLVALGAVSTAIEPRELEPSDACRIVFSSGTTGTPKGVEFTVAMLTARTDAARRNWMPADPFMCLLGLDTVSGAQTFYWAVLHGTSYLVPGTGATNLALIERLGVQSIKTSPARLADLLDARDADPEADVQLRYVQVAGSLLTPTLGERVQRSLGTTPIYLYGSTEIGTVATGSFDPADPHVVGRLNPAVEFALEDADGSLVTEPNISGSIRYRSADMPANYWLGAPADPSGAAPPFRHGWFYPGDVGALSASGELRLTGRTDDVVNASGSKFNLAELDIWLSELRVLSDAASFSFRDAEGTVVVGIAFVTRTAIPADVIAEQLRVRFPNLTFGALMKMPSIPRNQLGKVDRRALARSMEEHE